jgi:tripartite-type tricarboxylate transporter receptor subunit TctC
VQVAFANPPAVMPHIRSGKLHALAVTSALPSKLFPGLPTVAASGLPGYDVTVPTGLFAPRETPANAIGTLNEAINRALNRDEVKRRFVEYGAEVVGGPPSSLGNAVKSDLVKWGKVIKDAGIRVD